MKKFTGYLLASFVCSCFAIGCAEKSEVKSKTTVSTPGGSTTTTKTEEVKKTGDHKNP